jgi:hypothetical protein
MPGRYCNEAFGLAVISLSKCLICNALNGKNHFTNGEFIAMIADKLALEQRTA